MVTRLQEYHNELVSLVEFECRKSGCVDPTHAVFRDDVPGGKVIIPVFGEDLSAMKRAGYTVAHSAGEIEPPIPAYISSDRDRLAAIVANDGETFDIRRRGEAREDGASSAFAPFPAPRQAEPAANGAGANGMSSLYAKMAKVMGRLQRIPKSGHNNYFNYDYATEGDIADAVRRAMAEVGLAFFSEIVDYRRLSTAGKHWDNNKKQDVEKTKWTTYVTMRFTFACGDSGATRSHIWFGEADDDQDKGISKAVTLAEKYFLKSTFIISTGDPADDPDSGMDAAENVKPQSPPARPKNPGKVKPAPAPITGQPNPWQRSNGAPTAAPGEDKPAPSSGKPGKDQRAHVFLHKFDEPFDTTAFWAAIKGMSWNAEAHKFRTLNKMWEDGELGPAMTVEEAVASVTAHLTTEKNTAAIQKIMDEEIVEKGGAS